MCVVERLGTVEDGPHSIEHVASSLGLQAQLYLEQVLKCVDGVADEECELRIRRLGLLGESRGYSR